MPTSSNRSAFSNLSTPSSRRACSGPSSTSLLPWAPRTEAETAPNMAEQLRILLVEDSLNDAELILRELTRGGLDFQSRRVQTEPDFRRELREFQPHLVISDFSMPQFSGRSALAIVRESRADIPFIFISGTIGENVAVDMMKAGANDYVMKNNLARLLPALQRELREAEVRRGRRVAQDGVRERESKVQALIRQAAGGIFVPDQEGKFLPGNSPHC